jgi:hypothetical protein
MVDHTYQVVSQVDASLNGTDLLWYKRKFAKVLSPPLGFDSFPFCNCPGFAAFFDSRSYVSRYLLLHKRPRDELTYLLACAVAGLRYICGRDPQIIRSLGTIQFLLRQGADPNSSLWPFLDASMDHTKNNSAWGLFLMFAVTFLSIGMLRDSTIWQYHFLTVPSWHRRLDTINLRPHQICMRS